MILTYIKHKMYEAFLDVAFNGIFIAFDREEKTPLSTGAFKEIEFVNYMGHSVKLINGYVYVTDTLFGKDIRSDRVIDGYNVKDEMQEHWLASSTNIIRIE